METYDTPAAQRQLLQDHLDLRAIREQDALPAAGEARQVAGRGRVERGHERTLATVFGTVTVRGSYDTAKAEAAACDALIAPVVIAPVVIAPVVIAPVVIGHVVIGHVDWQAIDAMTEVWLSAHGLDHGRQQCGCTCGRCTCTPPVPPAGEQKAQLRRTMLALAADAMSGPGGLAAYLRSRELGVPYSGKALPLDAGKVKGIPDHLRRAVILRDRHCAWPGGCDKPPAGCHIHHLVYRSRGGRTRLKDLLLLCAYHHEVCVHRLGWTLVLHPDGTTEARSPDGQILRSHGPPATRAG